MRFKEWMKLEATAKFVLDNGEIRGGSIFKNPTPRNKPSPQQLDFRQIQFQASQMLDKWLEQPQVQQMLLKNWKENNIHPTQNKGFQNFILINKYSPQIKDMLENELMNKLSYYTKMANIKI